MKVSPLEGRIHYLDAMRGIMMILGVFYYAAAVYDPTPGTYMLQSPQGTELAAWIKEGIHLFRIPVFFVISGYFAMFGIHRYGRSRFLIGRFVRIGIPLLTAIVTINLPIALLVAKGNWQEFFFLRSGWIMHLWFLFSLLAYLSFAYLLYRLPSRKVDALFRRVDTFFARIRPLSMLFLLPLLASLFFIFAHLAEWKTYGLPVVVTIEQFPFFLIGMLFYAYKGLLEGFASIPPMQSGLLVLIGYTAMQWLSNHYCGLPCLLPLLYFQMLAIWSATSLCFHLFTRFADRSSRTFYEIADASYTIYLFHPLFVVLFGYVFIKLGLDPAIGLVLLIVASALASYLVHRLLISNIPFLALLYNGRPIEQWRAR